MNAKKKYTPRTGTLDISKARKELEKYSFSAWLDAFTRLRKTKLNLLPSEDNAGGEILYEDLTSSDSDSKASKSDCESLANDIFAVLQEVGTSTKFFET